MNTPLAKRVSALFLVFCATAVITFVSSGFTSAPRYKAPLTTLSSDVIYGQLQLRKAGLSSTAFQLAVKGWQKLKQAGVVTKDMLAICDFSQSSNNKRFYVVDLNSGSLLFNTLVAHGKNTGEEFARYFSNEPGSYKSSLGFYVTKETYTGQHGLSLKLEGQEPGFNHKAEERAIVLHGADYVSDAFSREHGRLGRSFGCPAVPYGEHEHIISIMKEGGCLFVYYPDKKYLNQSQLLR